jgi:hypothetical protein
MNMVYNPFKFLKGKDKLEFLYLFTFAIITIISAIIGVIINNITMVAVAFFVYVFLAEIFSLFIARIQHKIDHNYFNEN